MANRLVVIDDENAPGLLRGQLEAEIRFFVDVVQWRRESFDLAQRAVPRIAGLDGIEPV